MRQLFGGRAIAIIGLSLATLGALFATTAPPAGALFTFTVENHNASGDGSLAQYLSIASQGSAWDRVLLRVPAGDYHFTCNSGWPTLTAWGRNIEIRAVDGAARITQDCDGRRVLDVNGQNAEVTLSGLTITGGNPADDGGGILVSKVDGFPTVRLRLQTTRVVDNTSGGTGGGVSSDGSVALAGGSAVEGNHARFNGGGIFINVIPGEAARLSIDSSSVSRNTTDEAGGGVFTQQPVTLVRSKVDGNVATGTAGGLAVSSQLNVDRSTISSNRSGTRGGGVWVADLTATNSTFSGNVAPDGAGIYTIGVNQRFSYTTVAANRPGAGGASVRIRFAGTRVSAFSTVVDGAGAAACRLEDPALQSAYSLASDATCRFDLAPANPNFGPLGRNGGPTMTHLPNAPLLDRIPNNDVWCPGFVDQRGFARPRPQGGRCDIGAVER